MILLIFCFLLGRLVACYEGLMSAPNANVLVDQEVSINRQIQFLARCQIELKTDQFPRSCLTYLSLLDGSQATQINATWFERINQACEARLANLQDLQAVQTITQEAPIGRCQLALSRHQGDLLYIQKSGTSFEVPEPHEKVQSTSQSL